MKYCFGIDLGGTTVKCGLFSQDGELLEKWEIPTNKENKGEKIPQDIADTIYIRWMRRSWTRQT